MEALHLTLELLHHEFPHSTIISRNPLYPLTHTQSQVLHITAPKIGTHLHSFTSTPAKPISRSFPSPVTYIRWNYVYNNIRKKRAATLTIGRRGYYTHINPIFLQNSSSIHYTYYPLCLHTINKMELASRS
jgi:hypothetical protein